MFEPKVPVIAAAVGFVLSFLIGLFSGAAFPAFLFRAIGMALFLGAIVVVLRLIAGKFLPELLEGSEMNSLNQSSPDPGRQVDLTIGDEDDAETAPFANSETTSEPETSSDLNTAEEIRDNEDVVSTDENADVSEEDSVTTAAEPVTTGETVSEPEKVKGQPENKEKQKGGVSGLDTLPDLQDFVPEEKVVEEDAAEVDDRVAQSSGTGFSVPDVDTDGVETETMARAIRTILSKDN